MTDGEKPEPLLDDRQTERYARQIIVPDVGARGQARLCAATAAILGEGPGATAARTYLAAAGLTIGGPPDPRPVDCIVVAGQPDLRTISALPLSDPDAPIAWYALDDTTLRSGVILARELITRDVIPVGREPEDPALAIALHRIGGADAAGMAIAALLGWIRPPQVQELEL